MKARFYLSKIMKFLIKTCLVSSCKNVEKNVEKCFLPLLMPAAVLGKDKEIAKAAST